MDAYSREHSGGDRGWVVAAYILHLLGAVLALPSVIAVIINYIRLGAGSSLADDHHRWMIRTFWWAVLWSVLIVVLYFLLIGFLINWIFSALLWIWWVYRHVRGLIRFTDGLPMYTA